MTFDSTEKKQFSPTVVSVIPDKKEVIVKEKISDNKTFCFDKVFGPATEQLILQNLIWKGNSICKPICTVKARRSSRARFPEAQVVVYGVRTSERAPKLVAKVVRLPPNPRDRASISREADHWQGCHHENIVELLEIMRTENYIIYIMPRMKGTLQDILDGTTSGLNEVVAICIWREVIKGVHFLNQRGTSHRDLKPSNILLAPDGTIKLSDFGLACMNSHEAETRCGTPAYIAPEVLIGQYSTEKSDIFSLGLILHELLSGFVPIINPWMRLLCALAGQENVCDNHVLEQLNIGAPVIHLVTRCLCLTPERRPSLDQLKEVLGF